MPNETETASAPAFARVKCPVCHRSMTEHDIDKDAHAVICPPKLLVVLAENEDAARAAAKMHGEDLGKTWVYLPDAESMKAIHPSGWALLLLDSFAKREDAAEIKAALKARGFDVKRAGLGA